MGKMCVEFEFGWTATLGTTAYHHDLPLPTLETTSSWADFCWLPPAQLEAGLSSISPVGSLQTKFVANDPDDPNHPSDLDCHCSVLAESQVCEETGGARHDTSSINPHRVVRWT